MRNSVVLPAPLGPITPTMPPAGNRNDRSSISTLSPNALWTCFAFDDQIAQMPPRGNLDFQLVGPILERLRRQLFVRFDSRLALGLPRLGAHPNPLQFAGQRSLPGLLLTLFDRHPLLAGFQPGGVVALQRNPFAAVDFQDPLGNVVQEISIVRDGNDGAGVPGQVLLQPGNAFGIQVVGRFVQQQQVGLANQQLAKRHAASLAARQLRDIGVAGRQVHHRHRHFDLAIEFPQVGGVDRVLQLGHFVAQLLHLVVIGDLAQAAR